MNEMNSEVEMLRKLLKLLESEPVPRATAVILSLSNRSRLMLVRE